MGIPQYSWIQSVLHRFDPHADLSQGFDVDGNGKIEGEESLIDTNANGVNGDSEDWQNFLKKNPELRGEKSRVGFFKWGTSLKPTNPIHDRISIEAELGDDRKIQTAYEKVAKIAEAVKITERIRSRPSKIALTPLQALRTTYQTMLLHDMQFTTQYEKPLFLDNMDENTLDCDTSSDVMLAVAHEMGWPVFMVEVPSHVFVRWDDGLTRFNIDVLDGGRVLEDAHYTSERFFDPITVENNIYLASKNRDETASLYITIRGLAKAWGGDHQGAIKDYDQALQVHSKNIAAFENRATSKFHLHDLRGAIQDYDQIIKLDPQSITALMDRGLAKLKLGDQQGAYEDHERALDINPSLRRWYPEPGIQRTTRINGK